MSGDELTTPQVRALILMRQGPLKRATDGWIGAGVPVGNSTVLSLIKQGYAARDSTRTRCVITRAGLQLELRPLPEAITTIP